MNSSFLPIALLALASCAQCAKILAVFPMAAPSHYILGSSLTRALAEKGHDVTMISPFSEKIPPKNGSYRDIVLTGFKEEHERLVKKMTASDMSSTSTILLGAFFAKMMVDHSERTLSHPNVQKFIHSDEQFDAVIVEQFMNEAHKGFAKHFNASLIVFSTIGASSWINPLVGNPTMLSYACEPLLGLSSNMTLYQRYLNVFTYSYFELLNQLYVFPQQDKLLKKYFPNNMDLNDVIYNISIVLMNSHPSTNQAVPNVPNMIDIGGYHVKPPKKLPDDLQDFLDNSKEGVVYFSMGSNFKSIYLPEEKREAILNAFSKLKMKVLWKWEDDVLPGQPPNVRLGKWLPQQDILAHPNVKLFVTHAGLLSTTETIYHGVPVLAIPKGGDQMLNAQQIVNQGFGLKLKFADLTEDVLLESINELLTNPKYAANAKKRSQLFHDRINKPLDTAIYWVEYVIRHGGAPHLRIAGLDLAWYQYFLLDVILIVLITSAIVLFISFKVTKKLFASCCKGKKQKVKTQ